MSDEDLFVFAEEEPLSETEQTPKNMGTWKVLIVDDEAAIHETTKRVLSEFIFEDRTLDFRSAFSAKETVEILKNESDFAVILLDVVMEEDDSGLKVVEHIRDNLCNNMIRIVLRTGQPGVAPENRIIADYDINDYKAKSELTAQKLYTTMLSSLRSYRDLKIIERNRRGLQLIIESSGELYNKKSLEKFTEGVLCQLVSILKLHDGSMIINDGGFAATLDEQGFIIHAATGEFSDFVGTSPDEVLPEEITDLLSQAIDKEESIFHGEHFIGFFSSKLSSKHLLYMRGCSQLADLDKELIMVFFNNVSVALDNLNLNREIIDTQKEVVFTLGEVVENRSKETANHVRRVGEYSYLLAQKLGMPEEKAELLKLASPLHDVGKIGISDSVLLKPGKLTDEEYDIMKTHAEIGYEILNKSKRPIIKAASVIAHQHHERWDGKGYPRGIEGEDIDVFGRITSLVDVFDALAHDRCYRNAWPMNKVLNLIKEERGRQFDPDMVDVFLNNVDDFLEVGQMYQD